MKIIITVYYAIQCKPQKIIHEYFYKFLPQTFLLCGTDKWWYELSLPAEADGVNGPVLGVSEREEVGEVTGWVGQVRTWVEEMVEDVKEEL